MSAVAYKLEAARTKKKSYIFVETHEGDGIPRRASFTDLIKSAPDLKEQLTSVAALARTALSVLQSASPGKVELEFGVELGGEAGIPLVTKGTAKANFKVVLTWEDSKKAPAK